MIDNCVKDSNIASMSKWQLANKESNLFLFLLTRSRRVNNWQQAKWVNYLHLTLRPAENCC